jgi:hypothetical protein
MSLKNVFLVPLTEFDIYGEVNCMFLEAKLIVDLFSHYIYEESSVFLLRTVITISTQNLFTLTANDICQTI